MINPIGDLIIVERLEKETRTKGGIYLPLPNQKSLGRVTGVGRGIFNKHNGTFNNYNIEVGDIVVFQTHRGHSASLNDREFLFLSMKNVMCIYKNSDLVNGDMDININVDETVSGLKF
jgi:chaperonin GroES